MSLIFMDSFDHYTAIEEKWEIFTEQGTLPATLVCGDTISTTVGRFSNGSLFLNGVDSCSNPMPGSEFGYPWKRFDDETEIIVGGNFYTKVDDVLNDLANTIIELSDFNGSPGVNSTIISIAWWDGVDPEDQSSGVFITAGGADNKFLFFNLSVETWYHIEVRIKLSATVGEYEVRIDGVQLLLETGLDTLPTATTVYNALMFAPNGGGKNNIDDLYLLSTSGADNNTFLHDGTRVPRITVLRPRSNGNVNNFSSFGSGSPSNFETVDDALSNQDTDYVSTQGIGIEEDYVVQSFANVGITPTVVFGAQVCNTSKNVEVTAHDYKDEMVIAGTRYDNGVTQVPLLDQYTVSIFLRDTDPSDDADWTEAKIAALGCGFKTNT